jgi:hypothetical protein
MALAIGLALSCSRGPSLYIRGAIWPVGSPDLAWCSVELRDRNDARRTAGDIGVRAREPFSVVFTESQDKIITDESTQLAVLVSCDGFAPVQRPVWREHLMEGFDLGTVSVTAKQEPPPRP